MARFLYNLILMSISGSVMYLLGLSVRAATRGRYSCWYYALLVTAAVLLVVPFQAVFTLPKLVNIEISQAVTGAVYGAPAAKSGVSVLAVICIAYAAAAAALTAVTVVRYARCARNIKAIGTEITDAETLETYSETRAALGVSKSIRLMKSETLSSPLLFGIINPVIVIPDRDFTDGELKMIFAHELTHYRHKDLLIKLITSIAVCAHWFNPLVYFLRKSINECCELCCDECVLRSLGLTDKKDYGRLLLSVIEHTPSGRYAYTTAMASPKNSIKKRLRRIAEFKNTSRTFKIVSVMAAVSMTVCSVTAFGFSSETVKDALPEPVSEFIEEAVTKPAVTAPPSETAESAASQTADTVAASASAPRTYTPDAVTEPLTEAPIPQAEIPAPQEEYASAEEIAMPSVTPPPAGKVSPARMVDITTDSVSFGGDFTEKGQSIGSDFGFTSSSDATMAVYATEGNVVVTDMDTLEVIYDGSETDEQTARVPVKAGQRCHIDVVSDTDEECNTSVYAYGYSE